jgi:hypothetical protein
MALGLSRIPIKSRQAEDHGGAGRGHKNFSKILEPSENSRR